MFCTKCGTQISNNELYCSTCGGVNEYAQQLAQQNEEHIMVSNDLDKGSKRKKVQRKSKIVILISIAVLIVITGVVIKRLFFKTVEFNDEIIFLVVCEALEKNPGDKIYEHELDEIEVINIDDSYAVGRYLGGQDIFVSMNIDLSDLSKFNNLKEVNIDNGYEDNIYNLDALIKCKELEKITMFYNVDSMMTSMGHGCNELILIVENCSDLEYIDTVVPIPAELKERILEINPSIKLENNDEYTDEISANPTTYYNVSNEGVIYDYSQGYIPLEEFLKCEPTSLRIGEISADDWQKIAKTDSIRSLYVSSDFDIEYISNMDNLRCLTIAGHFSQGQMKTVKVDNVDALGEMNNIVSLSLIGCEFNGDLDVIGKMKNIKFLGYCGNEQVLPKNLDCYDSLYAFEYKYLFSDVSVEKYICDMSNLKKLSTETKKELNLDNLNELNYLELVFWGENEAVIDIEFVNSLTELSYLAIKDYNNCIVDWGNIGGFYDLSVINCISKCTNLSQLKDCKKLTRAYFSIMASLEDERLQESFVDITEVAKLKYLSYFGLDYSKQVREDWSKYQNICGLKYMDDNDVFLNICIDRYKGLNAYELEVYPNLR